MTNLNRAQFVDWLYKSIAPYFLCLALAACGGSGGSNSNNGSTPPVTPGYSLSLIAGSVGGQGAADGTCASARFYLPTGIATDEAGNVYVGDVKNRTIRKITSAGVVTTLAGTVGVAGSAESADGVGTAAKFTSPNAIVADAAGNLYVADSSAVRKITPDGAVSTLAGTVGVVGSADGFGALAQFGLLIGITLDRSGNLYVVDGGSIRKITPAGLVSTLAGSTELPFPGTSIDGIGSAARFYAPRAIVADTSDNLYVTDLYTVRKITPAGMVSTLAGSTEDRFLRTSIDGIGSAARFLRLGGITIGNNGNLFVTDNNSIRMLTPNGAVTTVAGIGATAGSADGAATSSLFDLPLGIAADTLGNLYVADSNNNTVRKISETGVVTTLAGTALVLGNVDGAGATARFSNPSGIAADLAGNLYVADSWNYTIRRITPQGVVSTIAGTAGVNGTADGIGAAANFNAPAGVAVDSNGNVFVVDRGNLSIRKITPGGIVTTIAGTARAPGSVDGVGTVAQFTVPIDIAVDSAGNLYITDNSIRFQSPVATIRKITPGGTVSTFAARAGIFGSADGTGPTAQFFYPNGIAVDTQGTVYVADAANYTIRMITPAGVVTTLAGAAGVPGSTDGIGATARFLGPKALAVDSAGMLYVVDGTNIRKVTPNGTVTTVAGDPNNYWGLQLGNLPDPGSTLFGAGLYQPIGVTVIDSHTLAITTLTNVLKLVLN